MAKIKWNDNAKKEYRTGVKDVALYVKDGTTPQSYTTEYNEGKPWYGVTALNLSPEGAEITSLYADNNKYVNLVSAEDLSFTIEAYAYPEEFAICNGEQMAMNDNTGIGMYVAQQARKSFGLVFRTEIGNANNAAETSGAAYEIHIIYNATASVSASDFSTINDSPEAITYSWDCSTVPEAVTGFDKKTAHLRIRSDKCTANGLTALLNALYGTDGASPQAGTPAYLPTPAKVIELLETT